MKAYEPETKMIASIFTGSRNFNKIYCGHFLIIYKSIMLTMQQEKDYVMVLERINAVGMAV
jgi:hypothetical protein